MMNQYLSREQLTIGTQALVYESKNHPLCRTCFCMPIPGLISCTRRGRITCHMNEYLSKNNCNQKNEQGYHNYSYGCLLKYIILIPPTPNNCNQKNEQGYHNYSYGCLLKYIILIPPTPHPPPPGLHPNLPPPTLPCGWQLLF